MNFIKIYSEWMWFENKIMINFVFLKKILPIKYNYLMNDLFILDNYILGMNICTFIFNTMKNVCYLLEMMD